MIKNAHAVGPLLVLDAGNSLVGDRHPSVTTNGASSVESMNMMGYQAMAIGQGELRLGAAVLLERMRQARFPFISANAVYSNTGQLVSEPYVILEAGGRDVAVVGITGVWDTTPLSDTRVLDPLEAARRVVPEAAKQADIVILLSNAGSPTDVTIADALPEIDFVVSAGPFITFGKSQTSPLSGVLLGHADYPSRGHAGRTVGKAALQFDETGNLVDKFWQAISLGPEIADDPDMAEWRERQRASGTIIG